ncbi:MAG TPA: hypothetical protein DDX19_16340 [Rhodopirellula baltica]|uniref:Uncharacterized protein n=1 Tax=Rhodopirellula baltica (strain DSM 10527 / NCIMB 13988 / SH1) TaxID=243090 RepID=Q7UFE8_RHOBA|nr:hypothetical protein RB10157 [Rhodopirellula baltica SH 1]HBE64270.1 hypothetical protein [Rhodopirellula baltica]
MTSEPSHHRRRYSLEGQAHQESGELGFNLFLYAMRKSPNNRPASRLFSDACQETIPLNGRACPEEKKFPGKDGTDRSGFSHEALAFVLSPQSTRLSR